MNFDNTVNPDKKEILTSWVKRRLSSEPSQYITGRTEFFGLPIQVNRHVLIPRPETERLVEVSLEIADRLNSKHIVDVGTGCGCVSIAIAAQRKNVRILAVDKDDTALEITKRNVQLNRLDSQVSRQHLDILSEDIPGTFDLLVSNPPYIPADEIENLMPEVRKFEPNHALTDGRDGLQFYRRFASRGRQWVRAGGFMVLEVGLGTHPEMVKTLFEEAGFRDITLYEDYNGDTRVAAVEVNR